MHTRKQLIEDVKKTMEFYQAMGFERLPVKSTDLEVFFSGISVSEKQNKSASCVFEEKEIYTGSKKSALGTLREEIGDCQRCRLSKGRKNIVFVEGSTDAELMFIGEGPGREEDIQARPFVGDAGKLLTRLIEKMGFKREKVYIANIVKCRPPNNRDPEEDEMAACSPFLEKQIDIIKPKIIMALGRISTQHLAGSKIPITKLRGNFFTYRDIPVMPTFHPAYLLRNPKDKQLTWGDAQKVLEKLNK